MPVNGNLPRPIVAGIAVILAGLLIYNVISDITVEGYEGYSTTLLLGGLLGGMLGVHRFLGRGGDDQ